MSKKRKNPNDYDEWGDPVEKEPKPKPEKVEADEWGDPIKPPKRDLTENEKLELEKRLVDEGMIFPRAHYMPKGRLRGIVAICLAFFLGIFITLGAIAGVGLYVGSQPLKKALGFFGLDASEYIGEDYLDKTIIDMANDIVATLGKGGDLTIGDITKYSPYLDGLLDDVIGNLEESLGVPLKDKKEALCATPFSGMTDFLLNDVAMDIDIGKVAKVNASSPAMLLALFYGDEGVDYEFNEDGSVNVLNPDRAATVGTLLDPERLDALLGSVSLGAMLDLQSGVTEDSFADNSMMYALAYGKRGVNYTIENGRVKVIPSESEEGVFSYPTTLADLMNNSSAVIFGLELGSMLGIDYNVTEQKLADNAMMYTLCYGTRGTDWELDENNTVVMLGEKKAVTIDDLKSSSNSIINALPLGAMLGLDGNVDEDAIANNALMYALSYGERGIDWELENGKIKLLGGKLPTTVGELTQSSTEIIGGMEVAALLGVKADSDKMMLYLAYGTELSKDEKTGEYIALERKRDSETGKWVYDEGDGRYMIVDGEIVMLPDPNHEDYDPAKPYEGVPFAKRKVRDLTDAESSLIKGMVIGDILDIDENARFLYAIRDWTIGDLQDQEKIKELKIGDIIETNDDSSAIMRTLADYTVGELEDPATFNSFTLGQFVDIDESNKLLWALRKKTVEELQDTATLESLKLGDLIDFSADDTSSVLKAMKDWKISDLKDQSRFERLKLRQIIRIDTSDPNTSRIMIAMADWRLSDLTDQSRIDSLKLSDVLTIDSSVTEGILFSLKDTPIGKLSDRIDSLSLNDMLGASAVQGNTLLKHLGESTSKTLADDMAALTIGEVFADNVYSYMEIKDGMTYRKLYDAYKAGHTSSNSLARPEAYMLGGNPISAADVSTYRTFGETLLTRGYFLKNGSSYTAIPAGANVQRDVLIVRNNRAEGADWQTPYYYNTRTDLTAKYSWTIHVYDKTDANELAAISGGTVEESAPGVPVSYKLGSVSYPIDEDSFGFYFNVTETVDGEDSTTRWDLDYELLSYADANGTVYTKNEEHKWSNGTATIDVLEDAAGAYFETRVYVYEMYTDGTNYYAEDETTERYEYRTGAQAEGEGVQLDRYMKGAWFLLFGGTDEEGNITFNADTPVLKVDGLITGISEEFTSTFLWELYFHGLLDSDPYVELPNVAINRNGETVYVTNLNDIAISELVQLVKKLTFQS